MLGRKNDDELGLTCQLGKCSFYNKGYLYIFLFVIMQKEKKKAKHEKKKDTRD